METVLDLHDWLTARGIDTAVWEQGATKSIQNLWAELRSGDCTLADGPPRRVAAVVQITIMRDGLTLVEVGQELADGRFRSRNLIPAEKMKRGETVDEAAWRCLREELGVGGTAVTLLPLPAPPPRHQLTDSPSYPGLLTAYTFYSIAAQVTGLPHEDFWRENTAVSSGDPVRRHLWGWRAVAGRA